MEGLILHKLKRKMENDQVIEGKIGATLKLKRKEIEKTLQQMSEKHGISISYLSKVENNHMRPNLNYISDILQSLQINEEIISSSLIMNEWYNKLVLTILNIESFYEKLSKYIIERDDYQAKFIKFSLDVYFNSHQVSDNTVNELLFNMELLKPLELAIFIFALSKYYITNDDIFMAGKLLKEIKHNYIETKSLKLWYYELLFELALYQESYTYLNQITNELIKSYYYFKLFEKAEEIQLRFIVASSYFKAPTDEINEDLTTEHIRSYHKSLVYYQMYDLFLEQIDKDSLAQLYFDNEFENNLKVKKSLKHVTFYNDPLEKLFQQYFKAKYVDNNDYNFLRNILFTDGGVSSHYYAMEFIANKLCHILKQKYKYKECYLVIKRLMELKNKNRISLKPPLI